MKEKIRIAIVGLAGESLFASGIASLLQQEKDFLVFPTIHISFSLLATLQRIRPDVVVMQSTKAEYGGFFEEILEEVSRRYPSLLITPIRLSETEIKSRAIHVLPTASISQLTYAVRMVATGGTGSFRHLQERFSGQQGHYQIIFHEEALREHAHVLSWTFQEKEVDAWGLLFYETDEIADRLLISPQAIRRLISDRIYTFLSMLTGKAIHDRATACRVSIEVGIYQSLPRREERIGTLREAKEFG